MFPFFQRRRRGYLGICAIVKNESRHLLEWIAYHHALGVERFYLYDNGSTDDTQALLAPLVASGLVDLTYWPMHPGQMPAYNDFAEKHRQEWEWVAFIDCDEFINPFAFGSIAAWLRSQRSDVAAVAMQWLNFGPSHHEEPPAGLQIDQYRYRLPEDNVVHSHVKTVVRIRHFRQALNPHAFHIDGQVVNGNRRPVTIRDDSYALQTPEPQREVMLNHYYTRSRRDWHEKVSRGRPDMLDGPEARRQLDWFEGYQRDAVIADDRIVRYIPETRAALERLRALSFAESA